MRQKSVPEKAPAEQVVKDIRRATRRQFSAEEKIRIVLEGVRGEESIAEARAHLVDAIDYLEQAVLRLGLVNREGAKAGLGTYGQPVGSRD